MRQIAAGFIALLLAAPAPAVVVRAPAQIAAAAPAAAAVVSPGGTALRLRLAISQFDSAAAQAYLSRPELQAAAAQIRATLVMPAKSTPGTIPKVDHSEIIPLFSPTLQAVLSLSKLPTAEAALSPEKHTALAPGADPRAALQTFEHALNDISKENPVDPTASADAAWALWDGLRASSPDISPPPVPSSSWTPAPSRALIANGRVVGKILAADAGANPQAFERGKMEFMIRKAPGMMREYGAFMAHERTYYPDANAFNFLMQSKGSPLRAYRTTGRLDDRTFVRRWVSYEIPYAEKGSEHFHDFMVHLYTYDRMPRPLVRATQGAGRFLAEVEDSPLSTRLKLKGSLEAAYGAAAFGIDSLSAGISRYLSSIFPDPFSILGIRSYVSSITKETAGIANQLRTAMSAGNLDAAETTEARRLLRLQPHHFGALQAVMAWLSLERQRLFKK